MKVKGTTAGCFTTYTLFLVAILSQSAAAQRCAQDTYYDPQTDTCQPCNEICYISDDICKRLCSEFYISRKAEICSKDTYYDPKVEACQPCQEVCPSLDDRCSKLCPDMVTTPAFTIILTTTASGGKVDNSTTWITVLSSPPWIAALIVISAVILFSIILCIFWRFGCIRIPTCTGKSVLYHISGPGTANKNSVLYHISGPGTANKNPNPSLQERTPTARITISAADEGDDNNGSPCVLPDSWNGYTNSVPIDV